MNQYIYFALGIVLGISLAVYYFMNREEKIESQIELDQKIYSTKRLDTAMENVVENINKKIKELKRGGKKFKKANCGKHTLTNEQLRMKRLSFTSTNRCVTAICIY